jgi:hypothetical protein
MFVIAKVGSEFPDPGAFALHVAHLVHDVPSAQPNRPGALRLCVTEGTVERSVLPGRDSEGVPFRMRARLGQSFAAPLAYRFRFFARDAFDAENKGCATTSLAPVAQLEVDKGTFEAGGSYTLAVMGALSPEGLCFPKEQPPLVQPGCTGRDPSSLVASVQVIDDFAR